MKFPLIPILFYNKKPRRSFNKVSEPTLVYTFAPESYSHRYFQYLQMDKLILWLTGDVNTHSYKSVHSHIDKQYSTVVKNVRELPRWR